jgi:hypothetical protein
MQTPNLSTIAAAYLTGDPAIPTPAERTAFAAWLQENYAMIDHMVVITAGEVSPETFLATWQVRGKMLISSAHSEHPFWLMAENVAFRAIHDWHHLLTSRRFDWAGEVDAYRYAIRTAPKAIHWILASEILGQAAAAIEIGAFSAQKLVRGIEAMA